MCSPLVRALVQSTMGFGASIQQEEVGKLQTLDFYVGHGQFMDWIVGGSNGGSYFRAKDRGGWKWNTSPTRLSLLDKIIRVYQTYHNNPDMTTR